MDGKILLGGDTNVSQSQIRIPIERFVIIIVKIGNGSDDNEKFLQYLRITEHILSISNFLE